MINGRPLTIGSAKKYVPRLGGHCEPPTLIGTKFQKPYPYWQKNGPKSLPLLAQIHKKDGLSDTTR